MFLALLIHFKRAIFLCMISCEVILGYYGGTCIQVDDIQYSIDNWLGVDPNVFTTEDCGN